MYVSTRAINFHGLKSNGIPDIGSGITFDTFLIGGIDAETDWQQIESGMDRIIPSWANTFDIYINASAFQGGYFDDFNLSAM
ncbi:hypothetical protein ABRQ01_09805 [Pectobacterium aroidearum]|uniref:hypothetical protein n=1 Tax=Pectobacterium aroidearum TaxID=1201031 RepID=UPI0032EFD78D